MKKKIWIFNHYANHMAFDQGGRHYCFAKYLRRNGYEPIIFCANMYNNDPQKQYFINQNLINIKFAEEISTPFVFVRVRPYTGNGKGRIINMIDFYRNVKKAAKIFSEENGTPDIILASSVHPLTMMAGIKLAKKFKVKCICEVRDLWPEAIVVYSKRIRKNSLLARIMYAAEKRIYKKADAVIFTQEGGPDYVREKGWDDSHGGPIQSEKLYHINNGVDLEAFERNAKEYIYEDVDLDSTNTYKVVYAGSVRRINNLGIILDAAKLITNDKIRFIVFGSGDELEMLKKRVADEKIKNVVFKGRINKQYIPSVVCRADLNLVHWEMSPLLRVGESYNKAFEYFAAGKPVFYTIRPGYSIVEKYKCGRLTAGFEARDIANGIQTMASLSQKENDEMMHNSRKVAKLYDFSVLTQRLIDIIEKD